MFSHSPLQKQKQVSPKQALGELTKKGQKKACYWFVPGTQLVLQVPLLEIKFL